MRGPGDASPLPPRPSLAIGDIEPAGGASREAPRRALGVRPARAAILEAVARRPGIHLRELQRETASSWGAMTHHLRALERDGLVRLERHAKHVHVYHAGSPGRGPESLLGVRGAAASLFEALLAAGPATQGELGARLGISAQLVSHHLRGLVRRGLVEVQGGRPKRYAPSAHEARAP